MLPLMTGSASRAIATEHALRFPVDFLDWKAASAAPPNSPPAMVDSLHTDPGSRSGGAPSASPLELDLLFACGSPPSESTRARISRLLAGPLDWPLLVELAGSHGLVPLLSRALAGQAPCPAHAEIRAQAAAHAMR